MQVRAQMQAELRKTEFEAAIKELEYNEKLADARGELDEPDNESAIMTALMPIISKAFPNSQIGNHSGGAAIQSPPMTNAAAPFSNHYSDAQLLEMYNQIPKSYRKLASKISPEMIKQRLKSQFLTDADDDSIERAVKLVKGNN